jgi:hypothetical protein
MRALSSTAIRSAIRVVENRCETATVLGPSMTRSAPTRRGGLEQRVLRLGVERGRWFVEDEEKRVVTHVATREGGLLPLPQRHVHATVYVGPDEQQRNDHRRADERVRRPRSMSGIASNRTTVCTRYT